LNLAVLGLNCITPDHFKDPFHELIFRVDGGERKRTTMQTWKRQEVVE